MVNSLFKKVIKKILYKIDNPTLVALYWRTKSKKATDKPVAFLYGFSRWKQPHMKEYLKEYFVRFIDNDKSYFSQIGQIERYKEKVIMVWGYEDNEQIRNYAKKRNIPFYRVEDGFIRSVQLGAEKSVPISLCIDSQALYYDATAKSDLEDILNTYNFQLDQELMDRARNCIEKLRKLSISKYNNVSSKDIHKIYGEKTKKRILVIGQVEDDQSIKRGSTKKFTNNDLVWIAVLENLDAEIIYKPHPDVLFNKRPMQSDPNEVKHIAKVITEPLSLVDSFETIDHVYTITSLSGFEALLRGIPVTTFGAPFYSGWGLTDDRQKVTRRKKVLTVEEIFAAAYILYPRYMNPFTKEYISIEEAIELLTIMMDFESKRDKKTYRVDGLQNKRIDFWEIPNENQSQIVILSKGIQEIPNLSSFLKGKIVFSPNKAGQVDMVAGWGMKPSAKKALDFSKEHGIPYISLEDGFIRSEGLGVEGSPPLSICIDHIGIYYDATRPSRLEYILENDGWEEEELLEQARTAMEFIVKHRISKYNHAPMLQHQLHSDGREKILVVDQTLGDMSISLGLAEQATFVDMYERARAENPHAHIFIKTHPDVISGKKQGNITDIDIDDRTTFIYDDCNPLSLLEQISKVYVVTSQLGFEALMLNKEVHCFGMPFYAGWGLTKDKLTCERRTKKRTIEEVFAAAYLIYPRYINPRTGEPGTIFDVLHFLAENRKS